MKNCDTDKSAAFKKISSFYFQLYVECRVSVFSLGSSSRLVCGQMFPPSSSGTGIDFKVVGPSCSRVFADSQRFSHSSMQNLNPSKMLTISIWTDMDTGTPGHLVLRHNPPESVGSHKV